MNAYASISYTVGEDTHLVGSNAVAVTLIDDPSTVVSLYFTQATEHTVAVIDEIVEQLQAIRKDILAKLVAAE